MKEKSKVKVWSMASIILLFIVLPLFAWEGMAQPKPQGTLNTMLYSAGEEGFMPDVGGIEQAAVYHILYDYLMTTAENGEPLPGLATRYEYSKDHLTLTFYLRKGIPWQDTEKWGEVTADDVKFSFDRIKRSKEALLGNLLRETIKRIEVVDPYTVAIHLNKPSPDLWMLIGGMTNTTVPIMCKKYIETVGDEKARWEPIGSGPYRLVEHKVGQYFKFEAADKHWRVVPEFKYLIVNIVPEESTGVAMLKTGRLDIMPITALTMPDILKTPGVTAKPWPGGYSLFAYFGGSITPKDKRYKEGYHSNDPWHKDKRVREAMNLAINREGIVKAVYKGAAQPMPIPWNITGFEKRPPIPYDPEKAKRLLAEAGYPRGFPLKVVAVTGWAGTAELPQVMEIVAANFQAIGLQPEIVTMDKVAKLTMVRAAKHPGMVLPWKESRQATYAGRFYQKFFLDSSYPLWQSDELSLLADKFESEADQKKRAAALQKVGDYWAKEWVTIPLIVALPVWAWNTKTVGEWPAAPVPHRWNWEYVRHAKPLNTWRLYTP